MSLPNIHLNRYIHTNDLLLHLHLLSNKTHNSKIDGGGDDGDGVSHQIQMNTNQSSSAASCFSNSYVVELNEKFFYGLTCAL